MKSGTMYVALCLLASFHDCAIHCASVRVHGSPCKFDAVDAVCGIGSLCGLGRIIIVVVVVVVVVVVEFYLDSKTQSHMCNSRNHG